MSVCKKHQDRIAREDARMPAPIRDVLSPPPTSNTKTSRPRPSAPSAPKNLSPEEMHAIVRSIYASAQTIIEHCCAEEKTPPGYRPSAGDRAHGEAASHQANNLSRTVHGLHASSQHARTVHGHAEQGHLGAAAAHKALGNRASAARHVARATEHAKFAGIYDDDYEAENLRFLST